MSKINLSKLSTKKMAATTAALIAAHTLTPSFADAAPRASTALPNGVCGVSQKIMAEELANVIKGSSEKITLARFNLFVSELGSTPAPAFGLELYTSDVFGNVILGHTNYQLVKDPNHSDRLLIKEYGGSGSSPLTLAYVKTLSGSWDGEQIVEVVLKYTANSDSQSIGPVKAKCFFK